MRGCGQARGNPRLGDPYTRGVFVTGGTRTLPILVSVDRRPRQGHRSRGRGLGELGAQGLPDHEGPPKARAGAGSVRAAWGSPCLLLPESGRSGPVAISRLPGVRTLLRPREAKAWAPPPQPPLLHTHRWWSQPREVAGPRSWKLNCAACKGLRRKCPVSSEPGEATAPAGE